jgi:spermidine/putrescine transport system permease protein
LGIGAAVTALCILLGYPFAYFLTRCPPRWRTVLLFLVIVPFWTSYVIRTYAWKTILGRKGVLNFVLMGLGLVDEPVELFLYNWFAVILVAFHLYIPFATLTLYASLEKLDRSLLEAARDLGASPVRAFLHVTLPLTVPGIMASILFVFIPVLGMYVTPTLVGGTDGTMIANLIVNQFEIFRLGLGAALAFLVTLIVSGLLFGMRRYVNPEKIFS